jgi:glyoxylase-like metal-dependent hydrolase (beta-lactamase superfamily II)
MARMHLAAMAATLAAAGAMTMAAIAPAAAQQPQITATKVEGTDNVYIFRNGNHQSIFIVTRDGVIATDPVAYGRPNGGQQYVDEIKKVTDKPIKYLIYSHHHYDHIAGGKAFKDAGATIIAHRRAKERLAALKDPATPLPDQTVGNSGRVINLGGTRLELKYVGLNHSDSTLVMLLPKEKLVFVVDLIGVGTMPGRGLIDFYPTEAEDSIKKIIAMNWERLIPGHPGAPNARLGTKKDAEDQLTILREASAEIQKLAREGKCWEPAERELKLEKYASWPGYANSMQFLGRRYCGLWGRGT